MANAPIIQFRQNINPYAVLSQLNYAQSALGGGYLPIAAGENSLPFVFRIYNNYGQSSTIAAATNVRITVFDAPDPNSHTAAYSPVSQSWIRVFQQGFGESAGPPALITNIWTEEDAAIGRSGIDSYVPELGSDGTTTPQIRAGSTGNGVGFIEIVSYVEAPPQLGFATYNVAISVQYDWTP